MSGSNDLTLATRKNQANKSQLENELKCIEKEKENELRMHNNEKQRFKAKYSKLDVFQNNDDKSNDSAYVRMYETHNPGFCYRRNGECRVPQTSSITPSVNYQDIHDLLFTNGEVDIEKVLCLHLLSTHRTETLAPPTDSQKRIYHAREQSPLERLIERSKKRHSESSYSKLLPTYVLDFNTANKSDDKENSRSKHLISDGRLVARLLVNDKIVQLIDTVLTALQNSNPEKMEELITLAGDPGALQEIVAKPDIQHFLYLLNGHTLISSCESYHLTPPFKRKSIPIELKTETESLEKLVKLIRKNVLQMPSPSTWKKMHQNTLETSDSHTLSVISKVSRKDKERGQSQTSQIEDKTMTDSKSKPNFINKNIDAISKGSRSKNSSFEEPSEQLYRRKSSSLTSDKRRDTSITSRTDTNDDELKEEFKQFKNQEKALLRQEYGINIEKENEEEIAERERLVEEETKMVDDIKKNMDYKDLAVLLNNKVKAAYRRDIKSMNMQQAEQGSEEDDSGTKVSADEKSLPPVKYSLKQTTCSACLEKWKTPLPAPKTPRLKKYCIPELDQEAYNVVTTKSTHRISQIIDEELEKISNGEASRINTVTGRVLKISPNNLSGNVSYESVVLNDLDLAKIRQEIRERETHKKLQDFLNSPI